MRSSNFLFFFFSASVHLRRGSLFVYHFVCLDLYTHLLGLWAKTRLHLIAAQKL